MPAAVNQKIRINILRLTGLLLLGVIMVTTPALGVTQFRHEMIEFFGTLLLMAGVLGRFWSIL